jgi:hypothetical protein
MITDTPEPNPEPLAYGLLAHAEDIVGEDSAERYLIAVVREIFVIDPGVLEHFVEKWFTDLTEELGRRGEEAAMRAVLEVKQRWRQEI